MTRSIPCLISALVIVFIAPSVAASHASSVLESATITRVAKRPGIRSKPPTVRSMQVKVHKAQARIKAAEAQAKAAQTALNTERSQHARSRRLNFVLAVLAMAVLGLAGAVCWLVRKRAIQTVVAAQRDLAYADRALEHQKALQAEHALTQSDRSADIRKAFAAMDAAAVQRDNLSARLKAREENLLAAQAEMAALKAEIVALEAVAAKRQAISAKRQIKVLKQASDADNALLSSSHVLNDDEQRLASLLQAWAQDNGVKMLAQVSMGEFLVAHKGEFYSDLFSTYNSKRVDFLICNDDWSPRFVIEHFGVGHFGKGYALQDEVKSRLLNLCGLALVITLDEDRQDDILEKVNRAHLAPASAVPACDPFVRVMPPWTRGKAKTPSFFKSARTG